MLKLERKEKGTMLFKDIVDAKRCAFFNDAADWRDAIRKSCIPLKKTGCARIWSLYCNCTGLGHSALNKRFSRCHPDCHCLHKIWKAGILWPRGQGKRRHAFLHTSSRGWWKAPGKYAPVIYHSFRWADTGTAVTCKKRRRPAGIGQGPEPDAVRIIAQK